MKAIHHSIVVVIGVAHPSVAMSQAKWALNQDIELEVNQDKTETEVGGTLSTAWDRYTLQLGPALALKNAAPHELELDSATDAVGFELSARMTVDPAPATSRWFTYLWLEPSFEITWKPHEWAALEASEGEPNVLVRTVHEEAMADAEFVVDCGWFSQWDEIGATTLQGVYFWEQTRKGSDPTGYSIEPGTTIRTDGKDLLPPLAGTQRSFSEALASPTRRISHTLGIGLSFFPRAEPLGLSGALLPIDGNVGLWRWEAGVSLLANADEGDAVGTRLLVGVTRQHGKDADDDFAGFVRLRSDFGYSRHFLK